MSQRWWTRSQFPLKVSFLGIFVCFLLSMADTQPAHAGWTNVAEPMGVNKGVYHSSIKWGDYDNDGDLDLAVAGSSAGGRRVNDPYIGRLIIFQNNGGGSFTKAAEPMGSGRGVMQASISWGDYDGDRDLDLAVSGWDEEHGRLIIFQNDGVGRFTNAAEPMGANTGINNSSIHWGDYDRDGDLDLVVAGILDNSTNTRFIIYRNDGGGRFTIAAEPMGPNAGLASPSADWGDYDRDADLDLVVSGYDGTNRRLIIYRNDGSGRFTIAAEPLGANAGISNGSVQWGDYDRDGDLDLAVLGHHGATYDPPRLIIYRNDGSGKFTNAAEPMGAGLGLESGMLQWGDYDVDGDLDLAVAGTTNGSASRLIIYRNDSGKFTNAAEPMGANVGVWGSSIHWGDYDGDRDLDLAVSGYNRESDLHRLIIYRNDDVHAGGGSCNVSIPAQAKTGSADLGGSGSNVRWVCPGESIYSSGGGSNKHFMESGSYVNSAGGGSHFIYVKRDGKLDISGGGGSISVFYEPGAIINNTLSGGGGNTFTPCPTLTFDYTSAPPSIKPPVADAGSDQTIEAASPYGTKARLDGSKSSDPNGLALTYTWRWKVGTASGAMPVVTLPLGRNPVTLTVSAGKLSAMDTVVIKVRDTTKPTIRITAVKPATLWPPNNKLVTVYVSFVARDSVTANPKVVLDTITISGDKPGQTNEPDIVGATFGTWDNRFQLRASKTKGGNERIYTVIYKAIDNAGNWDTAVVKVRVPQSHGQGQPGTSQGRGNNQNRSGLGDGTNPGQGSGTGNSPNQGTNNPNQSGGSGKKAK